MPPTKRSYIARRMEQANEAAMRAERYLSEVAFEYQPVYPEHTEELFKIVLMLETVRKFMRNFHGKVVGGRQRNMYQYDDLLEILKSCEPIPNPRYASQGHAPEEVSDVSNTV